MQQTTSSFPTFVLMKQGLSILIPTFNYDILPLVEMLQSQISSVDLPVEICIIDDASTVSIPTDHEYLAHENVHYTISKINKGRTASRHALAEQAQYRSLLFMDADVLPVYENFIANYLEHIDFKGIVFGGIAYEDHLNDTNFSLRYNYGKEREALTVSQRNKHRYRSINSGCFLINKTLFLKVNAQLNLKAYGMDLLFKEILENEKIDTLHIDNPVYHLGLETNEQFIAKSLQAVETTVLLESQGYLHKNPRKLQKSYDKLKSFGLLQAFSKIFALSKKSVLKNLISKNPNLLWFDLYRLYYYIQLKSKKGA